MLPLVYGYSILLRLGVRLDFRFDDAQRLDLLLTLLQSGLAVILLANMEFDWLDATIIFVLWLPQFPPPPLRDVGGGAYGIWVVLRGVGVVVRGERVRGAEYLWEGGAGELAITGG